MKPSSLIIHASHNQSLTQRWTSRLLTLLCWSLWIWLWLWHLPSHWLALDQGWQWLQAVSPSLPGLDRQTLVRHGTAVALVGATLLLWALVHRLRYRETCRRLETPTTTLDELAARVGLSASQLHLGRHMQRIVVHHHHSGGMERLENVDQALAERESTTPPLHPEAS